MLSISNVCRKGKPHPCTLRRWWCVAARLCFAGIHGWQPYMSSEALLGRKRSCSLPCLWHRSLPSCAVVWSHAGCLQKKHKGFLRTALDEAQAPMFYILHAAPLACALLAWSSWHTSAAFGLPGTLRMRDWSTPASASHYATQDEQQAATLAFQLLEHSDDET